MNSLATSTLLFALAIGLTSAICRPNSPTMKCSIQSIFLLDSSAYMSNKANADVVIDFANDMLLPKMNLNNSSQTTFISFGAGYSNNVLTNDITTACFYLDLLQKQNQMGQQNASLYDALQQIRTNYASAVASGATITILTRANDPTDIRNSANFITTSLPNAKIIIVVLYDQVPAAWAGFPAVDQFNIDVSKLYNSSDMVNCLVERMCGDQSDCGLPENVFSTSVQTTTRPAPTTPPATYTNINGQGCQCNLATSYNDIMLVVDTSKGMSEGLSAAIAMAASALSFLTLGTAADGNINNTTRVGMVSYATSATLVNQLGTLTDPFDLFKITASPTDELTNLAGALQVAINELNGTSHRPTSRKMIIVLAATFHDGSDDPGQLAYDFINTDKGIIFVWDYVRIGGTPAPKIMSIASPGYFVDSRNQTDQDLPQAICDANCFCYKLLTPFGNNNIRNLPNSGCYYPSTAVAMKKFADYGCQTEMKNPDFPDQIILPGYVATDRTPEKTTFLINLLAPATTSPQQLIGISYNATNGQYLWNDGQPLICNPGYCPWRNGVVPNPASDGNNLVLYHSPASTIGMWYAIKDNQGANYVCEFTPCDSMTFCNIAP